MKKMVIIATGLVLLAACEGEKKQLSFEEKDRICQKEKRSAEGPTGKATVGVSSKAGPFGSFSVSVSDKYIRGLDPDAVYDECMRKLSDNM